MVRTAPDVVLPVARGRRRTGRVLALPLAATALLAGCGAAQEAVSSATSSARQAAEQQAQDLAVRAFRSQACAMTADGTLSKEEISRLTGELDAAARAGLPEQVVAGLRPLLARGRTASAAQVRQVHASICKG